MTNEQVLEISGGKQTKTYTWEARTLYEAECVVRSLKLLLMEKYDEVVLQEVKELHDIFDIQNGFTFLGAYEFDPSERKLKVERDEKAAWETSGQTNQTEIKLLM